jgi:hypothetical protein
MRVISLFAVILLLAGCSSATKHSASVSSDGDQIKVIDAHTHARFPGEPERTSKIPQTKEEYLREFREANIVGAVSHSSRDDWNIPDLSKYGVVQCAGLKAKSDFKALEAGLRSKKFGCIKIYLGYVHQWAYDKNYEPAYKLAEKYDVPVVFHTGDTYSTTGKLKYADPLTVDEVAVDHPKVTFVIAHIGNPWIESAAEVAYKNPNVYLDGSAFWIGDLGRLSPETIDKYIVQPVAWTFGYLDDPKKLMFGTDWPLVNIKAYLDAFKRGIPREHWQAVLHDNAVRVFKIKEVKDSSQQVP